MWIKLHLVVAPPPPAFPSRAEFDVIFSGRTPTTKKLPCPSEPGYLFHYHRCLRLSFSYEDLLLGGISGFHSDKYGKCHETVGLLFASELRLARTSLVHRQLLMLVFTRYRPVYWLCSLKHFFVLLCASRRTAVYCFQIATTTTFKILSFR
jgi:hypothetical protein